MYTDVYYNCMKTFIRFVIAGSGYIKVLQQDLLLQRDHAMRLSVEI